MSSPVSAGATRSSLALAALALGAFAIGTAEAVSFHVLLLARLITGSVHGLFIGVDSVIASAVNAGIAAGSLIGGFVLARHEASATLVVAVILCALAIPATWATRFFTPPAAAPGAIAAAAGLDGSGLPVPGPRPQEA